MMINDQNWSKPSYVNQIFWQFITVCYMYCDRVICNDKIFILKIFQFFKTWFLLFPIKQYFYVNDLLFPIKQYFYVNDHFKKTFIFINIVFFLKKDFDQIYPPWVVYMRSDKVQVEPPLWKTDTKQWKNNYEGY